MSEWKEVSLGDVLNLRRGYDLPHKDMKEGNIPVAGSNGIIGTHDIATNIEPCITVGRSGSAGSTFIYERAWAHNTTLYVDDFKGNDAKYLYYLLLSLPLKKMAGGSAVPSLNRNHIHPLRIKFPNSIDEQRRIASILSSLDDKIAVNRRICENLEAQAQALFKHWFIDFAPFKDGKFVESELGMIPEGWRVGTLGDVVNQVTDKVGDRNDVRVLSPINTGKLVLSDEFFTKQVYSKSISKYIIVNPDDFAYNPARVNIGSIGRNEYSFIGCVSPVYVVFHCQEHYHFYIDFFRHGNKFKKNVEKLAIGGVRQTLRYEDMARISLVIPPKDVVISFNDIYKKMYETIIQKNDESSRLSTLRDTLLPKLMSGQIKL